MSGYVELVENQIYTKFADREVIHCLVYGDSGSQKTTFAATFPKPMLVLAFDSLSKMTPLRRRGRRAPVFFDEKKGLQVEQVLSSKDEGKAVIQIEYFADVDIKAGSSEVYACELFDRRFSQVYAEMIQGKWATVVLDSLTQLEYAIRKADQYKFNSTTQSGNKQDGRQHSAASAEGIEEVAFALARFNSNVVVTAHVKAEPVNERGVMTYMPEAPGKRSRTLASIYGETYYAQWTEEGTVLQTNRTNKYMACTAINAPDGCLPHYDTLWENYKLEQD